MTLVVILRIRLVSICSLRFRGLESGALVIGYEVLHNDAQLISIT